MNGDYIELSGDALAAFLEQPPVAVCGRCGRKTYDSDQIGVEDRMTQPDGYPCGGRFVQIGAGA